MTDKLTPAQERVLRALVEERQLDRPARWQTVAALYRAGLVSVESDPQPIALGGAGTIEYRITLTPKGRNWQREHGGSE